MWGGGGVVVRGCLLAGCIGRLPRMVLVNNIYLFICTDIGIILLKERVFIKYLCK